VCPSADPANGDGFFNNTKLSANWSAWPDGGAVDRSEISNDTSAFQQLMIVGNKSGGAERRVGVWDTLNVNGTFNANGTSFLNGTTYLSDNALRLRKGGDIYHGLSFAGDVDGPKLWGNAGGKLTNRIDTTQLQWNDAGVQVPNTLRASKVQLGDKWLLSGVGDGHANDDWLRLMNNAGGDYLGGFAAGRLWTAQGALTGSDSRLKKNIREIPASTTKSLDSLRPVQYNLLEGGDTKFGFVAQDVAAVYPNLVHEGPNGMLAVDYTGVTPLVVGNVQELNRRLNDERVCVGDTCLSQAQLRSLKALVS
jgi:hypothetical protein